MPFFVSWPLTIVLFLAFLPGVLFLMTRSRQIMSKICFGLAVFAVGGGFLFYSYGYLSSGLDLVEALISALRGILSTARMFFLNNDYGELVNTQGAQWLVNNVYLQVLFWLCHISALIVMQAALFSLFGRRLSDYLRLRFDGFYREVYIIKGNGKYALMLGENIATHDNPHQRPDVKRLIVFLIGEDDDLKTMNEKTAHFGGIVKVLDRKNDLLYYLNKTGSGKSRRNKKYNIVLTQDDVSVPDDTLLLAEFAKENGVNPENLDIFALISSEWDREKIERITKEYPYTIHIINEIDLLTRRMIEEHPPFECPGLNFNNGVAARDFTVMILGFGTVGQQAFLRLIMNGQFVGSTMRAIVVDREIEHLRKHFSHCHPHIDLSCKIDFDNSDVRDEKFFNRLDTINNVDYIVVALSDDEINRQTALDIHLHYERKDINTLPFIAVYEKNGGLNDTKQDGKIFSFGCREAVYKEDVVIREEIDNMAKAVHEVYGGNPPWYELDWDLQESNRASADFIPAMLKLAKVEEKEMIDKGLLTEDSELADILAQTEHLRWNAFHASVGYSPITIEEMHQRFENYKGTRDTRNHLDFCRRDSKSRLQVCLIRWNKLDKVSEAYRELARSAGDPKEQKRDFKNNDRYIVESIPKFLKAAKGENNKC